MNEIDVLDIQYARCIRRVSEPEAGGYAVNGEAIDFFEWCCFWISSCVDVYFVATASQLTRILIADIASAALVRRESGGHMGNAQGLPPDKEQCKTTQQVEQGIEYPRRNSGEETLPGLGVFQAVGGVEKQITVANIA
jgi:hypothetical protein